MWYRVVYFIGTPPTRFQKKCQTGAKNSEAVEGATSRGDGLASSWKLWVSPCWLVPPTLCDWGSRLAMPLVWEVRREDWKYYGGRLQLMDYKVRKVKFWLTLATCNCRVFMMDQQSSHNRWLHKGKVRSEREKNDAKLKCGWDSDCRAEST